MRVKGTRPTPLDEPLRQLLLVGPPLGKTVRDFPSHDELRRLWQQHGAAILASLPPRVVPWFVERDRFVRDVRREP